MKSNDKIIEEFREQFRPEYAGGGSIKNIVAYGKKLKSVKVDLSEVEQFILKALEQKEREIVEMIENIRQREIEEEHIWNDGKAEANWYKGFYQALDDILSNLKQPKE